MSIHANIPAANVQARSAQQEIERTNSIPGPNIGDAPGPRIPLDVEPGGNIFDEPGLPTAAELADAERVQIAAAGDTTRVR